MAQRLHFLSKTDASTQCTDAIGDARYTVLEEGALRELERAPSMAFLSLSHANLSGRRPLHGIESASAALWMLDLSYTCISSLEALSSFRALGYLNVQHTRVNLAALRDVCHVPLLHVLVDENGAGSAVSSDAPTRARLVAALPRAWVINGNFVTDAEASAASTAHAELARSAMRRCVEVDVGSSMVWQRSDLLNDRTAEFLLAIASAPGASTAAARPSTPSAGSMMPGTVGDQYRLTYVMKCYVRDRQWLRTHESRAVRGSNKHAAAAPQLSASWPALHVKTLLELTVDGLADVVAVLQVGLAAARCSASSFQRQHLAELLWRVLVCDRGLPLIDHAVQGSHRPRSRSPPTRRRSIAQQQAAAAMSASRSTRDPLKKVAEPAGTARGSGWETARPLTFMAARQLFRSPSASSGLVQPRPSSQGSAATSVDDETSTRPGSPLRWEVPVELASRVPSLHFDAVVTRPDTRGQQDDEAPMPYQHTSAPMPASCPEPPQLHAAAAAAASRLLQLVDVSRLQELASVWAALPPVAMQGLVLLCTSHVQQTRAPVATSDGNSQGMTTSRVAAMAYTSRRQDDLIKLSFAAEDDEKSVTAVVHTGRRLSRHGAQLDTAPATTRSSAAGAMLRSKVVLALENGWLTRGLAGVNAWFWAAMPPCGMLAPPGIGLAATTAAAVWRRALFWCSTSFHDDGSSGVHSLLDVPQQLHTRIHAFTDCGTKTRRISDATPKPTPVWPVTQIEELVLAKRVTAAKDPLFQQLVAAADVQGGDVKDRIAWFAPLLHRSITVDPLPAAEEAPQPQPRDAPRSPTSLTRQSLQLPNTAEYAQRVMSPLRVALYDTHTPASVASPKPRIVSPTSPTNQGDHVRSPTSGSALRNMDAFSTGTAGSRRAPTAQPMDALPDVSAWTSRNLETRGTVSRGYASLDTPGHTGPWEVFLHPEDSPLPDDTIALRARNKRGDMATTSKPAAGLPPSRRRSPASRRRSLSPPIVSAAPTPAPNQTPAQTSRRVVAAEDVIPPATMRLAASNELPVAQAFSPLCAVTRERSAVSPIRTRAAEAPKPLDTSTDVWAASDLQLPPLFGFGDLGYEADPLPAQLQLGDATTVDEADSELVHIMASFSSLPQEVPSTVDAGLRSHVSAASLSSPVMKPPRRRSPSPVPTPSQLTWTQRHELMIREARNMVRETNALHVQQLRDELIHTAMKRHGIRIARDREQRALWDARQRTQMSNTMLAAQVRAVKERAQELEALSPVRKLVMRQPVDVILGDVPPRALSRLPPL